MNESTDTTLYLNQLPPEYQPLLEKLVDDVVSQIDYDIYKQAYNLETAEDPKDVQWERDSLKFTAVQAIREVFEKAMMFDALCAQQRVEVDEANHIGDENYQYLSLRMWSRHLSCETDECKNVTAAAIETFKQFAAANLSTYQNKMVDLND